MDAFDEGRERGAAWARAALESATKPDDAVTADAIQAALGQDRGERAWGFLFGVREVINTLPKYERPRVLIEVADPRGVLFDDPPPGGLWARFKATFAD